VIRKRRRVTLPPDMPGAATLPKYLLQEFHHLPNGNYSKRFTEGYITGFDRMMLGEMQSMRRRISEYLHGCKSVLDVGTAGGNTAAALAQSGVPEVWAMDPSPYLLQYAAARHPHIRFVQGVGEAIPFPAARFDGLSVCFVLHEIPPKYIAQCLKEFRRTLKTGGLLAICEPSAFQLDASWRQAWRHAGWRGVYFKALAHAVYEPFVRAWHKLDIEHALREAGFELCNVEEREPARHIFARAC
jgi:ubiquinone/menaquinone biosynthesis C-methylase UbiE